MLDRHDTIEAIRAHVGVPLMAVLATVDASRSRFVVGRVEEVVLLGVAVPALSALFGIAGVALGQLLAPALAAPLGLRRRLSLIAALMGLELGIVIATGQRPLIAMAWGIGLGFSGMSVAQLLGEQAVAGGRKLIDAFTSMIAARIGGSKEDKTL